MSEQHKSTSPQETTIRQMVLVVQNIASNALLFVALGIYLTIQTRAWQAIQFNILSIQVVAMGIVSVVLIRRGQSTLGGWLFFASDLLAPIWASLLVSKIGYVAVAYILITTYFMIRYVVPRGTRIVLVLSVFGVAISLVTEFVNPSWRLVSPLLLTFSPIFTAILGIVFIGIVVRQTWSNSLRAKLITTFLGVTIIPLIIISTLTYYSSYNALTNDADQKLAFAAKTTAQKIDAFIEFNLETVRAASQFSAVRDYLSLPESQRSGSEKEASVLKFLTSLSRQDPVFISSVAIFDTKGISLADTVAADIGLDKSSRSYFKATLLTGLPYASDVEYSATSGVPSIYFAAPVRDANGKVLGIIRIRYTASILQKLIIQDTGLAGSSSYAVLLDSNHVRLAHGTDRDRVFKSIVPLEETLVADLQSKGLLKSGTPQELSTNLTDFENGLNNIENVPFFAADTNSDGALEEVAVSPLSNKNWSVAFIQSENVFLSAVTAQTNNNLLTSFIIALIVAVIGFLFSQNFAGPVIRLTQTAEAIAGGNINIQAQVETSDEIGILAGTFNRMTQQLREFITSLEERVAARTKDLEAVAEVGTATATILETDKLLLEVVNLSKERFNLYHSHIYLLDEDGKNLVLAAGAGEPGRQMKAKGLSIPLNREQSLVARAARERRGVTVNDVTQAPDFLPNPLLPNTRSELAVPMIVGGKVIGVFDVQSDVIGRFTDSDINIQTTLAAQVSTSIQNVRSFEQSKAQADLESLVNSIGQKIQRAASVEETLQTAIRELGQALGASRVTANIQANRENVKASSN